MRCLSLLGKRLPQAGVRAAGGSLSHPCAAHARRPGKVFSASPGLCSWCQLCEQCLHPQEWQQEWSLDPPRNICVENQVVHLLACSQAPDGFFPFLVDTTLPSVVSPTCLSQHLHALLPPGSPKSWYLSPLGPAARDPQLQPHLGWPEAA